MIMKALRKKVNEAIAGIAVMLFAVVFMTSCNKEETKLLETVPSDARVVAVLDVDRLLKDAGCQKKNNQFTVTPDVKILLDRMTGSESNTQIFLDALSMIDSSELVAFNYDNEWVLTFNITDEAAATASIASVASDEVEKIDGYTVYQLDGAQLVIKESQGWIAEEFDDVAAVVKAAAEENYTVRPAVVEFLGGEGLLMCAINDDVIYPVGDDYTFCASVTSRENVIRTEIVAMNPDGKLYEIGAGFDVMSTDFLRYVPSESVLTFAMGNINSKSILRNMLFKSLRESGVPELFESVDGTVALSIAPAAGAQALSMKNLTAWDFSGMIHMPQEQVNTGVEMINQMAVNWSRYNVCSQPCFENGQYHIDFPSGVTCYYGNIDGYLAASTREISPTYNNSLTDSFEGKRAALVVDIPYGSELMKASRLPYGMTSRINLQLDRIVSTYKFNGSRSNAIATLVEILVHYDLNSIYREEISAVGGAWM